MLRHLLAVTIAIAPFTPVDAQEAPRARLLTIPDETALSDHFPVVALARGVSGRVVLECDITVDGNSTCSAAEEAPADMGFGASAEALAADWRFEPRVENGAAVASTSRIPIIFANAFEQPLIIQREISVAARQGASASEAEIRSNGIEVTLCRNANCPRQRMDMPRAEYPARAYEQGIDGRALLACSVRSTGAMNCAIEREAPEGYSFGEAALQIVAENRGEREAGEVFRVPIDFFVENARGQRISPDDRWVRRPRAGHFARVYPSCAIDRGLDGQVYLFCSITSERRLVCDEFTESPQGYGFGHAAAALAAQFEMSEQAFGLPGLSEGDRIILPITFQVR